MVIVGDGVKVDKEAYKMPGVKKQYQESDNSSKAEYMFGHLFGAIGILIGKANKLLHCVPVSVKLHDGVDAIRGWDDPHYENNTHVVQMIIDGFDIAETIGKPVLFLLDRYFLSVTALKKWLELGGNSVMTIVTKAKLSCIAYENPIKVKRRGRPAKKGKRIKLKELFNTHINSFTETTIDIYGKEQTVNYLAINLLWGLGFYQELRFVLVDLNGAKSILVSTDLNMCPIKMITLYSYRFKIEVSFRELKQTIRGFSYHFWNKVFPKINRFSTVKANLDKLDKIIDLNERKNIIETLNAIEGYVLFSCISLGLLQIISLKFDKEINNSNTRWLRTKNSNKPPSVETVKDYLNKRMHYIFGENSKLLISTIIREAQTHVIQS